MQAPPRWLDPHKYVATPRVCVLKPYISSREKGVIHVKFSEVISTLPFWADLQVLSHYFRLVLEPSWTGLCDPGVLQYAGLESRTIVMAPDLTDFTFIQGLESSLVPVALGPCDWVDPRVAEPFLGSNKDFDIVVNSNWAAWKRHHVLLSALRQAPATLRVALIGGSHDGGTLDRIFRLAKYYGVQKQITAYQFIAFQDVMKIVSASRCSALLSLKEGANRSLAESMFCNVPALLLGEHIGGIRKNVVPETGCIVPERELCRGLMRLIEAQATMSPREWAISNISCMASTAVLEREIKRVSELEGEQWTSGIVVRANSPESTYFNHEDKSRLQPQNAALLAFLRGEARVPVPD
jgi:glycosyltransferase involved in cell wall biosynthesis